MDDLLIGFAVLASVSALFGLGWYLGRRTEIQRQVDDAFRRETRLRHPAATHRPAPRRTQPAPWLVRGLSARAEVQAVFDAMPSHEEQRNDPQLAREAVRSANRQLDVIEQRYALSDAARGSEWPR